MGRSTDVNPADRLIQAVTRLGYKVTERSASFVRPESGERVPAVYVVETPGITFRLRDDELEEWNAFVENHDHPRRLTLEGLSNRAVKSRAPFAVVGPISSGRIGDPSRDYPQFATHFDLGAQGYVEEEYFFSGEASSLAVPDMRDAVLLSDGHSYQTRLIVRRPKSPLRFNGTVIVEWLNVTTFANVDQLWWEGSLPWMLMSNGFAYVGLSVQRHGVHAHDTGLRNWSPSRYSTLDLTDGMRVVDDSLSFDLFSQGGRLARDPSNGVLGGMSPTKVLAFGASQSQRFLRLYLNSVHHQAAVYDGFLLALGDGLIRENLDEPVFRVNTETDVLRGSALTRQADSSRMRTWEVSGASHLSYQMAQVRAVLCERDGLPPLPIQTAEHPPLSRIPWGHALASSVSILDQWVRGVRVPSLASPLTLDSSDNSRVAAKRDKFGNALGGLRLSQHEVATATNQGLNTGPGLAPLWGIHIPFDRTIIERLYPDRQSYVEAVRRTDTRNLQLGFILESTARTNLADAEAADFGVWT